MNNAPCKGCEERYRACHDTCPKYKAYRDRLDAINAESRREGMLNEVEFMRGDKIIKSLRDSKIKKRRDRENERRYEKRKEATQDGV